MATESDAREIALSLPATDERPSSGTPCGRGAPRRLAATLDTEEEAPR
jgi:hypothetical protein